MHGQKIARKRTCIKVLCLMFFDISFKLFLARWSGLVRHCNNTLTRHCEAAYFLSKQSNSSELIRFVNEKLALLARPSSSVALSQKTLPDLTGR